MATTARPRLTNPDTSRAVPSVPAGARLRAIPEAGPYLSNQYGNNQVPVDTLNAPLSLQQAPTTFLPGDPVRATPGLDDGQGGPRTYGYIVGGNINPTPRDGEIVPFAQLRGLAKNYYGIGLCLEVHNRIIQRLEPQFMPRQGVVPDGEDPTDPKWTEPARKMADWLLDGPNYAHDGRDLHGWLSALHRDLMEVDGAAIYHLLTRAGYLSGLRAISPDTIKVLHDQVGELAMPPYAAYRQVLYGAPAKTFTKDDLDYLLFSPRNDSPYGISPVERVLLIVNEALRKQDFDLRRFTDGSTPSGLLKNVNPSGGSTNWTPQQVQQFEAQFNNMLAGNTALRVRVKALPPGWDFVQNEMDSIDTTFDRFLLNVVASCFGVTMDELGFTETSNRSVGDSQEAVTYRNAIKPRADFLARYLSRIARRYDGTPLYPGNPTVSRAASPTKSKGAWDGRYLLTWGGIEEPDDFTAKAQAVQGLFTAGVLTRLQAKRQLKLPVEQGEEDTPPFTVFNGGMTAVIPLADLEEASKIQFQQLQTQLQQAQVGVQTAQAGLKIQQDQGKMLDKQVTQANHPQEGEGEDFDAGDENGPDGGDNGTGPSGASAPSDAGEDEEASPESESPSDGKGSGDENEDSDAEAQVDALIAQAKAKTTKGKAQRVQMPDETRWQFNPDQPRGPNGKFMGSGLDERREAMYLARKLHDHAAATAGKPPKVAEKLDRALTWGRLTGAKAIQAHLGKLQAAARDGATMQHMSSLAIKTMQHAYLEMRDKAYDMTRPEAERKQYLDEMKLLREHFADYNKSLPPGITKATLPTFGQRMQIPDTDPAAISDDWRNYRRVALKAVQRGERVPPFVSDVLPQHLHTYATEALSQATTADAVRAVFAEVREAETHPGDCRCLVCGCGEPYNSHDEGLPTLQPDAPASVAPHTDVMQRQLSRTECPTCGQDADRFTETGYWHTGMVCPVCGHLFTATDDHNTGCMVAFFLPASVAQQLAIPGGEPVQDLHITLAFLGDAANVDRARLLECVKQWAATQHPLYVDLDHVDTFTPSASSDAKIPLIVRSYTAALFDLRADLVAALDAAGVMVDQAFPEYKPHVTLMYVSQGDLIPALPEPNVQAQLSQVWVAYGDERYVFPLGSDDFATEEPKNADVVAELRAMQADIAAILHAEY